MVRMGDVPHCARGNRRSLMFETLQPQKPDAILTLVQMFRDDPRSNKIIGPVRVVSLWT